jgi:hypothetical protein
MTRVGRVFIFRLTCSFSDAIFHTPNSANASSIGLTAIRETGWPFVFLSAPTVVTPSVHPPAVPSTSCCFPAGPHLLAGTLIICRAFGAALPIFGRFLLAPNSSFGVFLVPTVSVGTLVAYPFRRGSAGMRTKGVEGFLARRPVDAKLLSDRERAKRCRFLPAFKRN